MRALVLRITASAVTDAGQCRPVSAIRSPFRVEWQEIWHPHALFQTMCGVTGIFFVIVVRNRHDALPAGRHLESAHILRDGEIVHSGDASSLINDTEVLSSYLGR